ncbi:MAG: CoB--CoM heterodisulfide reductase iron-sulfur subunit B family protein [Candidatus Acetothermia bacterium]|jgi:heterodisulfide reductase subunit B|nr:CoB--CoM heterodisulfide reductase iron-sulfur subunit B family protein [Candidatus Acetothermia bacterium]MDH7506006.1 CoB--CoM heterodisulfide reductase iron-sulfur subunit B family protein [Candidatus Acetothermia bacterium]
MSGKSYVYYPGCSVKGSARQYEESLLLVFRELALELVELEDWNCCGSSLYSGVDKVGALALAARNLALAERAHPGKEIVAPCSACYLSFLKAKDYMERYPKLRAGVDQALRAAGLEYRGRARVRHPLEVVMTDLGVEELKRRVKRPLRSLVAAPYYGCQTTRPYAQFDHPFFPESLDELLRALGAEVVDYPLKTKCCGSSITGMAEQTGLGLVSALLLEAQRRGANAIVTVCPLCQFNLDCYQGKIAGLGSPIPVLYFTQALGLALGLPEKGLGFARAVVSAEPLLAGIRG